MLRSRFFIVLISFIFCTLSFVIVRFADNFLLSIFLDANNIFHDYYYFYIEYKNGRSENWSEGKLIFINTVPYLASLLTGIYLPHFTRNLRSKIFQLFIVWFSFHLVLLFVGSLISGLFQYQGLGIALVWFLQSKALQIITVMIILFALTWSARRFTWYFLRCSSKCEEVFDDSIKWRYLKIIALFPFLLSCILILSFNKFETILNHSISMASGLLIMAIIFHTVSEVFIPKRGVTNKY